MKNIFTSILPSWNLFCLFFLRVLLCCALHIYNLCIWIHTHKAHTKSSMKWRKNKQQNILEGSWKEILLILLVVMRKRRKKNEREKNLFVSGFSGRAFDNFLAEKCMSQCQKNKHTHWMRMELTCCCFKYKLMKMATKKG